jgi:stage II sporulation protein D
MRERQNKLFHVESTVMDQVFRHISEIEGRSKLVKSVIAAVESTKGQYLADKANLPIKAYFHADCGGVTADAKEVWGVKSTEVVVDKGCEIAANSQWSYYIGKKEVAEKLSRQFKLSPLQTLQKIELIKNSTRVAAVRFIFSQGDAKQLTADQLRALFGYNLMKSAMFHVKETANGFNFEGRGHGHGVGLCQWGSKKLGSEGKNHQEILTHYYPTAKLQESATSFAEFRTEQSLLVQTR